VDGSQCLLRWRSNRKRKMCLANTDLCVERNRPVSFYFSMDTDCICLFLNDNHLIRSERNQVGMGEWVWYSDYRIFQRDFYNQDKLILEVHQLIEVVAFI